MPEELSSPSTAETLGECVEQRFGIVPNFFRLAPETPEITEKLWRFAQAAYLDNLLPSVLKERLCLPVASAPFATRASRRFPGSWAGLLATLPLPQKRC
jgi:hypothetical protein